MSETEPDETGGESILSVFRHHADEVGEALFMHIMVANDGAPRHLESVQGPADHSIGGVAAIIRNIAGKKGEADRIGEGGVDLGNNGSEIMMILFAVERRVEIANVHPGKHLCGASRSRGRKVGTKEEVFMRELQKEIG